MRSVYVKWAVRWWQKGELKTEPTHEAAARGNLEDQRGGVAELPQPMGRDESRGSASDYLVECPAELELIYSQPHYSRSGQPTHVLKRHIAPNIYLVFTEIRWQLHVI
jgi:hypothetical protein